jgi:hypothetical protein
MSIDAAWLQLTFPTLSNLTPLNHGGQKWVFSGTHPTDGSIVLKFFHPQTDPDRAMREVQAVVTIQSPRVPKIYEVGVATCTIGQLIWVREQRLNGQNLRERLQAGPFDPAAASRLTRDSNAPKGKPVTAATSVGEWPISFANECTQAMIAWISEGVEQIAPRAC